MTIAERRKKVLQMYTNGLVIDGIAELLGVSAQSVRSDLAIMGVSDLPVRYDRRMMEAISVDDVRRYRDRHPDGSTLEVMGGVRVIRGYPFIAITNKGTYTWSELAVRAWRRSRGLNEVYEGGE